MVCKCLMSPASSSPSSQQPQVLREEWQEPNYVSLHASQRHITVDKRANVAQLDKRARVWLIRRKETRARLAHCRQWKTSQVFATESERKDRRFDTEEALESGDTYIAGEAVPVRGLHKGSRPMGTMVDGERCLHGAQAHQQGCLCKEAAPPQSQPGLLLLRLLVVQKGAVGFGLAAAPLATSSNETSHRPPLRPPCTLRLM